MSRAPRLRRALLLCATLVLSNACGRVERRAAADEPPPSPPTATCDEASDCAPDGVCIAGACVAKACEPEALFCVDDATAGICNTDGTSFTSLACIEGRSCAALGPDGCTSPLACVPGDRRCLDPSTPEVCLNDGTGWVQEATCADQGFEPLCHEGQCLDKCGVARLTRSYVGCEYWGADLGNFFAEPDDMFTFAFAVSNTDDTDTAHVVLKSDTGELAALEILPGELGVFEVPPPRPRHNAGTGLRRTAYLIESDVPVSVYQFNPLETADIPNDRAAASTDASLLLPAHSLDDSYVVLAWEQTPVPGAPFWQSFSGGSLLAVVAAGRAVSVTLTPTASAPGGPGIPSLNAAQSGVSVTYELEPFEVLQLTSVIPGADFTGTTLEATGAVAVFAGNECARVPAGGNYCDHLEEQLFGLSAWGTTYVATKSFPRGAEVDTYRVIAAADGATVTFTPPLVPPRLLAPYESFDLETDADFFVSADEPILVAQYFHGSASVVPSCDVYTCSETGDPSMVLLPPVGQFRTSYVFLTPDTYQLDFINLVLTADVAPTLDGVAVSAARVPLPGTPYFLVRLPVSDGPHALSAASPLGLVVYGYGGDDDASALDPRHAANVSYGYPGGLNLLPINTKAPPP